MKETMSAKERWLAAIRMQPVDRLPFWPKLNGSYPPAQGPPFTNMSVGELHDWIGSDKHIGLGGCVKEVRERTSVDVDQKNGARRTVFRTPHGTLESVHTFDSSTRSWHPTQFPIKNRDDIRLMTEFLEDTKIELNRDSVPQILERAKEIGDSAVTATTIGESPLMNWVEWTAGVENSHYLLSDYPEDVKALFEAEHHVLLRKTEITAEHCPADLFYFSENTSTTLISPSQYRSYCSEYLKDYRQVLDSRGKNLVLHMCGLLKDLLGDVNEIGAPAFEAFTSPPLGDTTLLDGRSACPEVCLIGGTNAVLWTQPYEEIVGELESHLNQLPHHRGLVITSSGVMPPWARPDSIRKACEWVKNFDLRN